MKRGSHTPKDFQLKAMIPNGWLIDPKGKCLLLFHKDPMCLQRVPRVYIDKWSATPTGMPLSFVNRRKVRLDPALETWAELIRNGWEKLESQFGDAA